MAEVRENQPLYIVQLQKGEDKCPLSHNADKVISTERRGGAICYVRVYKVNVDHPL